jgi:branched-chain amino acid transport system ATP-binding protein
VTAAAAHAPAAVDRNEAPAVELESITVRFGGVVAVDEVSMTIGRGETVGLIGPNGAGKTTLLDVVAGVRRPRTGKVHFSGRDITRVSALRRARLGVARTFQKISLMESMTVREHLLLGYLHGAASGFPARGYWARRQRAEAVALADDSPLGVQALLERLELEAVADKLASEQPVGVVRMVDLARALASRPRLLLLDEPVSGLSEAESESVGALLQWLRNEHEMAILVIEHNIEFARSVSHRIVALDFGKKIADGAPADVLASPELRRAYFGVDADKESAIQFADPDAEG